MSFTPRTVRSRRGNRLVHPGEILLHEWMVPCDFSQNALARRLGVAPRRINEIVLGKRGISADTAIGLAAVFGTSEHYWMALQADYELEKARELRELWARVGFPRAASRQELAEE
jgi:addiction module HigA family antidote